MRLCPADALASFYFAPLMTLHKPPDPVIVTEHDRAFDISVWNMVLSDHTLTNLQAADPAWLHGDEQWLSRLRMLCRPPCAA